MSDQNIEPTCKNCLKAIEDALPNREDLVEYAPYLPSQPDQPTPSEFVTKAHESEQKKVIDEIAQGVNRDQQPDQPK